MQMSRRAGLVVFVSALTLFGVTGCKSKDGAEGGGSSADSSKEILVGEYGSVTGSEAAFGEVTHQGIMLAVDEINKAGGIEGKQIKIIGPEDTESNNQKAEIAVKRLVEKKVIAVLGEVASSRSLAGAGVCQNAGIPMISPSSTNPKVTEVGSNIFRVCFIDPFQGAVIAKFAADSLKAKTAAIFYDQGQTYSTGIRDEFTKAFTAKGGRIVAEASYAANDKDFSAQLTKLKSSNPDVIVVPGYYTEGGTICKQARDLGITAPLLGGDGWSNSKFHEYAGSKVSNVYFSDHASMESTSESVKKYVADFKAKYPGKEPDSLSALGYDAMMVLADALKRSKGAGGAALAKAIGETKDFKGISGSITINAQRNADKGAVIMEVSGGKFKFKEAIDKI
jgi:branched-chain amino acid transport system substrate-binding protein